MDEEEDKLESEPERKQDSEWREHPHTRELLGAMSADEQGAYLIFLQCAQRSTDPEVRASYWKWRTIYECITTMEKGLLK